MKKKAAKEAKATNFHVRVKPGTAEWLRGQITTDAPSVPAVIKEIIEAQRRAERAQAQSTTQ